VGARTAIALGLAFAALVVACGGDDDEGATPPKTEAGGTAAGERERPLDFSNVETVATGLEVPWGLAFVDERTILVTERQGRVRVIEDGRLRPEPALELDAAAVGEAGLLGIALHPDFPAERFVFVYYTTRGGNRVSRFRADDRLALGDERVLLDRIPASAVHDGGRLAFGPDGLLYVSTGDAGSAPVAADRRSLAGKILRIAPDGSIPEDNPFGDSPVFSYGHRNPQGFDWDAERRLYGSEHGPSGEGGLCCHDELNRIELGEFYGWPFRAGETALARGSPPRRPVQPLAESGEATWAPAGVVVDEPAGGERALLVATLAGERLLRFPLDGSSGGVGSPETVLSGLGRLRAAELGPDGCLYLTTSNRDGRGQPREGDDRIVRVCRR
jgi:glucose/arabinose dehydrogenase